MIEIGNIIYFDPFYFKNGKPAKPKFFLVLAIVGLESILASLPTSQNFIPQNDITEHSCIDLPNVNMSAFILSANKVVTECGKHFSISTYLYGHQIDSYLIEKMKELYPINGRHYKIWGKVKSDIFSEILDCFIRSKVVKRKYLKILKNQ
jgi:hypothetical protein